MERGNVDHGCPEAAWKAATAETRQAMVAVASRWRVSACLGLVARYTAPIWSRRANRFTHLLAR